MTLTLDLPHELEAELSAEADEMNIPLSDYILRVLTIRRIDRNPPKTGVELVNYWRKEGLIGTRSDIVDSQKHARILRDSAEIRPPST